MEPLPPAQPSNAGDAPQSVPSSREFTILGVTYGLYVAGLIMLWPSLVGMIIAYVKRDDVAGTFLHSHYGWLIRMFWWWVAWFVIALIGMVVVVVPPALELAETVRDTSIVRLPWQLLGGAVAGGTAILVVWCWVFYRLVRGILRLADGRAVP